MALRARSGEIAQMGAALRERQDRALHGSPSAGDLDVSRETLRRLDDFVALLLAWSERVNLIGAADRNRLWSRHIADSLQLLPLLQRRQPPFADLGSGAGFPGLVLAIAAAQPFHLIEADQRKAAFLREAIRVTAAPATVHAGHSGRIRLAPVSLVTARAVAPLATLLGLAAPLLHPDGVLLALKGAGAERELTAARAHWNMHARATPSRTDASGRILEISGISRIR
jgi:16S rRNA (guanine527-N7)-methyltransferase